PMAPPKAPPPMAPPSAVPFTPSISDLPPAEGTDGLEVLEEPGVQGLDTFIGAEPATMKTEKKKKPRKKDEKAELLERLQEELPYLPDKMKKNIIKELFKRPEGKLRETWFKVYVHKNKQYATKPG
ncbi:MAG: hypothetical protein HWN65_09235, partial [Candidatus Helarchaeota archaeon]|nr:hypothetical protein [Candidatus Helarchaeota archaeon]